jgi:hypothetical protein
MKWIGFQLVWLLSATFCYAVEVAGRSAPEPVSVEYLASEVYAPEKGYVIVRSAFEVNGPAHRWIALDVEFRLNQATPLVRPDGKAFMKRWNDLFLPESPSPVRWTDCRLDVDFRELEQTKNLPKDKTFVVWAMGLMYDHVVGKHVGTGWPIRAAMVLTTDATGRIQTVLTPTFSPIRFEYPSDNTIDARRAILRTKHLKPLQGVRACRVVRRDATPVTVLVSPKGQIWQPGSFGGAFGPIDSAEKAEEFVRLLHPGGVILHSPEQYNTAIDAARKLGWPAKELPQNDPESYGLCVTPIEGLGWRVETLLIEPNHDQLGDIVAWDYCISTDGGLSAKRNILFCGPSGKIKTPVTADVYTTVLLSDLAGFPPDMISPRIVPTNDVVKLPLPAEMSADDFAPPADGNMESPETIPAPDVKPVAPTTRPGVITTPGPTPIRKPQ